MIVTKEFTITKDRAIGKFFDTTWDYSDIDTMLYQDDEPVGRIAGWEKKGGEHVFHVFPYGAKAPDAFATKPVAGELRICYVITPKGEEHYAIDVI